MEQGPSEVYGIIKAVATTAKATESNIFQVCFSKKAICRVLIIKTTKFECKVIPRNHAV